MGTERKRFEITNDFFFIYSFINSAFGLWTCNKFLGSLENFFGFNNFLIIIKIEQSNDLPEKKTKMYEVYRFYQ